MGFVVCITMLMGLVVLRPTPWHKKVDVKQDSYFELGIVVALIIFGLWNAWYGVSNINGFWKIASFISGLAMIFAGGLILRERQVNVAHHGKFRRAVVAVLAVCFLLYAVTLIQLNLGYPILR